MITANDFVRIKETGLESSVYRVILQDREIILRGEGSFRRPLDGVEKFTGTRTSDGLIIGGVYQGCSLYRLEKLTLESVGIKQLNSGIGIWTDRETFLSRYKAARSTDLLTEVLAKPPVAELKG